MLVYNDYLLDEMCITYIQAEGFQFLLGIMNPHLYNNHIQCKGYIFVIIIILLIIKT